MVLSIIFLEDKHKMLLHLSIFYEYQQFFQHSRYSRPITVTCDPLLHVLPVFFLIMLFNKAFSPSCWFHPSSLTDAMSRLHHNSFLQYRPFLICLNWRTIITTTFACTYATHLWVLFGACWRSDSLKNTFNRLNSPWQDNIARIEKHFYAELAPLKQNDKVADVRILGAIGIIEMVNDSVPC